MNPLQISVDYLQTANYALFHNHIPVCHAIELTNISERPVDGITVSCTGEFISRYDSETIAGINPGETVRIGTFSIIPEASELASITERVVTEFTLTVTSRGAVICEGKHVIELMPYDHWTGIRTLPQTIASFITPNHPAINSIVLKSAEMLKRLTGSSSLNEYQTGDCNDVRQQVAAVFAAIHGLGIVYRGVPASYEAVGQRITMPDQVVATKIANCIELTLLMATVLEAIGINCVIIFQKGHAYLGVWLVNDCYPCSVCDDPSYIEKKCSCGIDEMLVIECTHALHENASFGQAVKMADANLAQYNMFELFVDIKRSRLERILPLPSRIENNGAWSFDNTGVEHDSCLLDVKEHDRFDLSRLANTGKELTKFDMWERKLLDFSLRNTLLNLSFRRRSIQLISFDIDRIEDHLHDGKEYCIKSKPDTELPMPPADYGFVRSKLFEPLHDLIHDDIEHHHLLHTFLAEAETVSILKHIYRTARNTIEETGANPLYLAIGALRWFETPKSTIPRYAPLLLLPVEMVYKKSNYYIRTRDEDISLNITLMEFLRQNYDIIIDGLHTLPADNSGVDVRMIFAIIRDALKEQKGWDVEEECLLGNFSFSKFLMWNDIHTHREQLAQNDIINSLLANRLTWTPTPAATDLKNIDQSVPPTDLVLPVSADSSQIAAVIEGSNGNSFILYGPPGTGKSQTITNLIANALYQGKRVLFVAEKMAALSVVQKRLADIGLDPFCLELHSNKSTKRHVLQQLEKALKVVHIVAPAEFTDRADRLFARRKELIAYIDALHTPDTIDGLSLYDCIIRYEEIGSEPLEGFVFDDNLDALLQKEGVKGIEDLLGGDFEVVLKLVGQPSEHPLNGLCIDRDMVIDSNEATRRMADDALTITTLRKEAGTLSDTKALRERLLRDNLPAIFSEDPATLHREWRRAKSKWFIPRMFAIRSFINYLRQFNEFITVDEVDQLIENLTAYRRQHEKIDDLRHILRRHLNIDIPEDEMPDISLLDRASEQLGRWSSHPELMRDWFHWSEYGDRLKTMGLGCVVDVLATRSYDISALRNAFLKALFKYKADVKIKGSDTLATFEGMLFDEKIASYRRLTDEFQTITRKELYARLAAGIPRMTDNTPGSSEIGLLNRNISNGGRGQSLRDLFDQLPTLMPRLCPCMLMSPMSVAQYIDLSADKFDLVIFDEASQMPTSEAVGAIARGNALIVVGDPKQMPPTSYFANTVEAEDAGIDDMESILEDCRTLDMPSLQLSWHYRSRHESLIAFSNNEYYDGSLITFPSVDDRATKVHYVPVTGCYDKGGSRSNRAEAEAIVSEIVRRIEDEALRRYSIGVIAFNVMQQGLIEDLLQERFDRDRSLQELASSMPEPIFVKNLENVQGDERDVILFSIGYGPDREGRISMNFGPLNNAGGERRLNVAVSRARHEMYIFSTLKSSDIDLRRSKARGVEGLKHFLQYAETQALPSTILTSAGHQRTLIARQIADELRKRGYAVATDVGRSRFRIDVAVCNPDSPGVYDLGILLDGEAYRDTHTTRDREIVQPAVLTALDWKIMRVWSVDWFNNRERVIDRIIEKINTQSGSVATPSLKPAFDISAEQIEKKKSAAKKYVRYFAGIDEAINMPDAELMHNIISIEQPICFTYLCRRISSLRNIPRMSQAMVRNLRIQTDRFYTDNSDALWISPDDSHEYVWYRYDSGRDISDIPDVELANVATEVLTEQVAINTVDLIFMASRKLGFSRRSTNIDAAFQRVLTDMKSSDTIEYVGENIRLKTRQ
ncbi:DUF4011 domain-containing protein [Paramuribaculum intestinale]|uniref:DUF4011 domain-containing protein n=1 Tax=Paramuribaculum intestinale TaxID=2094151 RepID=UPI0025B6D13A|nr:DUF4011 domain-containing protein [Paramuribaculum intestinale]